MSEVRLFTRYLNLLRSTWRIYQSGTTWIRLWCRPYWRDWPN